MTLPLCILFLFLPVRLSSLSDSFSDSLINFIHLPNSYFLPSAFLSLFVSLWFHITATRTRQWTQSQVTISYIHSELKVQQTEPPSTVISTLPFTITNDNYTPSQQNCCTAAALQLKQRLRWPRFDQSEQNTDVTEYISRFDTDCTNIIFFLQLSPSDDTWHTCSRLWHGPVATQWLLNCCSLPSELTSPAKLSQHSLFPLLNSSSSLFFSIFYACH